MNLIVAAGVLLLVAIVGRFVFTPVRGGGHPTGGLSFLLRIPVPWVYVLVFLAGLGAQRVFPMTIRSGALVHVAYVGGIVLIAAGVTLAFSGLGLFRLEKTTTIPGATSRTLVMRGPYRFTRNPMYVGLLLVYVGVAGVQAQLWPILLLPILVSYLQRTVIPLEEGRLAATFGDIYLSYCGRVRRWL